MQDLFASPDELEKIPMAHADVAYLRQLDLGIAPECLLAELIADVPWRSERITVWGKSYPQPRLIAWYGDPGRSYTYSGITLAPLAWTSRLEHLKALIQDATQTDFNSVLLNYYRNERDSMGFHSDDEPELGASPVIASLSLGQARQFVFKAKDSAHRDVKIILESGSLLVMKGSTQKHWKHGIPKESKACGPRVNLTFRRIGLG